MANNTCKCELLIYIAIYLYYGNIFVTLLSIQKPFFSQTRLSIYAMSDGLRRIYLSLLSQLKSIEL